MKPPVVVRVRPLVVQVQIEHPGAGRVVPVAAAIGETLYDPSPKIKSARGFFNPPANHYS